MNGSTYPVSALDLRKLALKLRFVFSICLLVPLRMLGAMPAPPAPASTTTLLTISSDSSVAGSNLRTLKAYVTSAGQPASPGQVVFCNADAVYCEDFSILGQAQVTKDGSASVNLILTPGLHNVRAEFRGTNAYAASASSLVSVSPTEYPTTTTISVQQTADTYAFSSTVSGRGRAATGLVVFRDANNKNLPVARGFASSSGFNLNPVTSSTASRSLTSAAVADMDGDGKLDQLAFDSNENVVVLFGRGDGTFTAGPTTRVGGTPTAITVGDFNNDGLPDFGVMNTDDGTVGIYLAKGGGFFLPVITVHIGASPSALTTGDFDHDGNVDLAVSWSGGTAILLGDGDGHFSLESTLNATALVNSTMHVADLNGDGIADLLLTDGEVEAFIGNGDGTFRGGTADNICDDFAVADFDGDGKPDLALMHPGVIGEIYGNVTLVFGKGDGNFYAETLIDIGLPTLVTLGDFDGDGKPDLAVLEGDQYNQNVFLYFNDGTFNPSTVTLASPYAYGDYQDFAAIPVGDFNNDGVSDFAPPGSAGPVVLASFSATAVASDAQVPLSGSFGLHNIFANYVGDETHLTSVSGPTTLQGPKAKTSLALNVSPLPVSAGQTLTLTATVSSSDADINQSTGTVTFFSGPNALGSGSVSAGHVAFSTSSLPIGTNNVILTALYRGDNQFAASASLPVQLNKAGTPRPDSIIKLTLSPSSQVPAETVVTLSASVAGGGNTVRRGLVSFYDQVPQHSGQVLLGQAQITYASEATVRMRLGSGSHSIRAVFQGTNALTGSASASKALTVTGQTPADAGTSTGLPKYSVIPQRAIPVGIEQPSLVTADFNGDGILDLAVVTFRGKVVIFLGKPDGTFTESSQIPLPFKDGNALIAVADFNSDGTPDLAVLDEESNGFVDILVGKGDGTFTSKPPIAVGVQPKAIFPGDFNGDGVPDMVVLNQGTDGDDASYSVLLGRGDATFTSTTIPLGPGIYPGSAVVADLNKDGTPDIAIASLHTPDSGAYYNTFRLLLGNGDGTFTTQDTSPFPTSCGVYSEAVSLAAADFNGDGFQDLFFIDCYSTENILLGNGDATFTPSSVDTQIGFDSEYSGASTVVVDLNGDGILDLVIGGGLYVQGTILLGKGDGLFTLGPGLTSYLGYTGGVVVGDFNGDGVPDVITTNSNRPDLPEWFGAVTAPPPIP